ncbi:MAG: 3-phosphoshikimate 1-carboxyvinyltransferase [Pseudomonadota bacterium]
MDSLTLNPVKRVDGVIHLPGSKSLSNRVLLLAALAQGETRIDNLLASDDVQHMLNALHKLGVDASEDRIRGVGGAFPADHADIFLGNSGTTTRSLCAALCLGKGNFMLHGEPRMHERPIGHLVDALTQLEARVDYLEETGYPPLRIYADGLSGGKVQVQGNISSQFLTGLMLAAPLAEDDVEIEVTDDLVSKPYIDITIATMKQFGVEVEADGYQRFRIKGGQTYQSPGRVLIEGDASSASYFLAAAAIKGGTVRVTGIGKNSTQGDTRFVDVLEQMGATAQLSDDWIEVSAGESLKGIDIDANAIPDAAMTLATTALFAEGPTCIRNIYNWRVKETDRISAMTTELRKLGATVEEGEDYIAVTPPEKIRPATIATYDDHRIAMSFSLAALGDADITILDPNCVSKTVPDYFNLFRAIQAQ